MTDIDFVTSIQNTTFFVRDLETFILENLNLSDQYIIDTTLFNVSNVQKVYIQSIDLQRTVLQNSSLFYFRNVSELYFNNLHISKSNFTSAFKSAMQILLCN